MSLTPDTRYLIALACIKGMNKMLAQSLLEYTGTAENLFLEQEKDIQAASGIKSSIFSDKERKKALETADRELEFIEKKQIDVLFYTDPAYPARLSDCPDAPVLLFYKGNAQLNARKVISIVGTRRATPYGKGFCDDFVRDIAAAYPDTLIVSGLAYGIDIAAHRAAMDNRLPTVGVLAHGLHTIYPPLHRQYAAAMTGNGGVLTEYLTQQPILKPNFVARNRIVAGMADATLIVESAAKGGALITARLASEYHRDVFAVPGRIGDDCSKGCNRLIFENKAALITSTDDFIDAMCWERPAGKPVQQELFPELDATQLLLLDILQEKGECHINQLSIQADIPAAQVLAALLDLEFVNLVRSYPGGLYRKA
ncbi:MAG: DNA-processing protein DprA [Coprobacter sp.]|nr:DNA-processing protein DprA [Coprobacter sp.]